VEPTALSRLPCEDTDTRPQQQQQQQQQYEQQQIKQQLERDRFQEALLQDVEEFDDDEDRCLSFLPTDLRLLGLQQQHQQQQQQQQQDSGPSVKSDAFKINDSGLSSELANISKNDSSARMERKEEVEEEEEEVDFFLVDEDKDTPLHVAVIEDEDAAVFLISKAKDASQLNLHNKSWSSPIHLAAKTGNANSVRDLILGGANVMERDAKGNTALHIACARGHYDVVLALTRPLSRDDPVITDYKPPFQRLPQNLEIFNYDGLTCFQLAALHRRKRIMSELLRLGCDVDAAEARSGRTALHFAVEKHDLEVVKYLLQDCRVDVDAEAFDGSTPLCLAEGRGFFNMATLLRSYAADRTRGIQAFRTKMEVDCSHDRADGRADGRADEEESDYASDFDSNEDNLFGRY